jgi:aspartyl-tRNA(Asn)/glutamyl-tRNA(Gln) amidotransferase subunit A
VTVVQSDLAFASAFDIAAAIRARQVSPVEIVRTYLERIRRLNPQLNACITVLEDEALAAARDAERALVHGEPQGQLFGVPIAVKDQFWSRGTRTTNGSRALQDFVPDEDATVVARLKAAGAILIAKLNMSELALGGTRRPPWGTPHNPWDHTRTPGESSSGCGVAVAAHLCAASLGEDTGGSGRWPAAYCGIVGLRPTYGLVSRYGTMPACWFLDAPAPMTKTARDAAVVLGAIAGHDPKDLLTSRRRVPDYVGGLSESLAGIRVGVIAELDESDALDPEVRRTVDAATAVLHALGATVRRVNVPLILAAGGMLAATCDIESAAANDRLFRTQLDDLDGATRTRLLAAALLPVAHYGRGLRARVVLRQQLLEALGNVDVLVSATSPYPPPLHDAHTATFTSTADVRARFFMQRAYLSGYSLAALPALSVPCGFTNSGLPVGMQIAGRPFSEGALLSVAHAYESATSWHTRRAPAID